MLSKTTKLLSVSLRLSKLAQFPALAPLSTGLLSINNFNQGFPTIKSFCTANTKLYSTKEDSDASASEQEEESSIKKETENTSQPNSLENFNISQKTKERLRANGINSLFPIQATTYDAILEGKDIIARDATGSGKTLSYVLPICEKFRADGLFKGKYSQAPLALVVLPTRELALQVTNVFNSVKHNEEDFRVLTVYGGADARPQIESARRGIEILVGTPGRLIDLIERGAIDLSKLKSIVLDEADHMLDMGFQEDIEKIYQKIEEQVGEKIQTMLHSATMPSWVHDVAKKYLRDDIIKVDLLKDKQVKMPKTVSHYAINCPYSKRNDTLADIVLCYGGQHARTIIFTETKKEANDILIEANIRQECQVLHGGIPQEQREVTFRAFREGKFKCLIATNVAARGLDIPEVDLIIQLDPPGDVDTYIHRAGRTARAGKSGVCVTLYSTKTIENLEQIERKAKFKFQKVGVPQPEDIIKASSRDIATSIKNVSHDVTSLFMEISQELIQELGAEEALSRALALVTGTTEKFKQRSLLSSNEGFVTYELNAEDELHDFRSVLTLIRDIFPPHLTNSIKDIKRFKNLKGAVFDLPEQHEEEFTRFMENVEEGFEFKKAEALPELEDYQKNRDTFSSNRGGSRNFGDRGGSRSFGERGGSRNFGDRGGRSDRFDTSERTQLRDSDDMQVFISSLGHDSTEQDIENFFTKSRLRVKRVKVLRGKFIIR